MSLETQRERATDHDEFTHLCIFMAQRVSPAFDLGKVSSDVIAAMFTQERYAFDIRVVEKTRSEFLPSSLPNPPRGCQREIAFIERLSWVLVMLTQAPPSVVQPSIPEGGQPVQLKPAMLMPSYSHNVVDPSPLQGALSVCFRLGFLDVFAVFDDASLVYYAQIVLPV
ncbi:uncharacterized protein STEHIDRAFT_108232 [Stereum hirsutum FP-91666 SS1]|uniref:uncharacterized protein n=1 Tax=Stereum hirsutum (strain FP-91666) TaxID=721885 RepID=UPI000440B5D0|nr:uncharacterized protein STEHIDRAFT_108232 [Stereum hirsutum FP-91666 SS1]EIM89510.1 hypothetical protein STEHIDRAFT_108232 [Stereum hirsutum FP-91666 SS1]